MARAAARTGASDAGEVLARNVLNIIAEHRRFRRRMDYSSTRHRVTRLAWSRVVEAGEASEALLADLAAAA